MEHVDKLLVEADCQILTEDRLPQQANKENSGVFLEQMGIEIPPQDSSRVTDEGTMVQEKNTGIGDARQV
ncbi:unnamed protein product [Closterium sp. NIES-54]